jgi:hypothetical protein
MFAALFVAPVFSESLEGLIGKEKAAALLKAGTLTEVAEKATLPTLLPQNDAVWRLVHQTINALEPNMLTETLHLYKKPPGSAPLLTGSEKIALFNETLALSTLAGLQYYSDSRKTMRTFYETSAVIDNPASKKVQKDPYYAAPPLTLTLYARQKDLTFGDNIYQYDYGIYQNALIFVQQNVTSLTVGIIPAVGKNKLRSVVAVIDAGEYLLVYAASFAKTVSLPGMRDRIGNSFSNRAAAILSWFTRQADKAFEKAR